MKAQTFQWLVLITGVMLAAGGGCRRPAAKEASPTSAPAQPFIFYDEAGDPSESTPALSGLELQEIIDWMAAQTPDPVWLIRVRPSIGSKRGSTVAYLVPDEATPRIRAGRAYDVPESRDKADIHSPWKYVQVPLTGHTIEERLVKPSAPEMPFRWPVVADPNSRKSSPMSLEEVGAIVDFARRQASSALIPGIRWETRRLPIVGISRDGDVVRVAFGFQHGPLWGHGVEVEIRCTATGYEVVGWSKWIS